MKNKLGRYPHELAGPKLVNLFKDVRIKNVQVMETHEESVKKMFNNTNTKTNKKDELGVSSRPSENYLNLDKRIHKILDSIRSKKDCNQLD